MSYQLIPATTEPIREKVIDLLTQNNLPVSDLDAGKLLFAFVNDQNTICGTAGLEVYTDLALIRSISTEKSQQGKGIGTIIIKELEKKAAETGIKELYLLTTTAQTFFTKLGYKVIDRSMVPPAIKESSEFSSVCPSSAIVMTKSIDA